MTATRGLEQLFIAVESNDVGPESGQSRRNLTHSTSEIEDPFAALERDEGEGLIPSSPSILLLVLLDQKHPRDSSLA